MQPAGENVNTVKMHDDVDGVFLVKRGSAPCQTVTAATAAARASQVTWRELSLVMVYVDLSGVPVGPYDVCARLGSVRMAATHVGYVTVR